MYDFLVSSPFGGIPRNWKLYHCAPSSPSPRMRVPPSGGSLEIGNSTRALSCGNSLHSSPFGGIPRNWKLADPLLRTLALLDRFPLRGDP